MTRHHAEPSIEEKSFFDSKPFFNYTIALHCTLFYIRIILQKQKPWFCSAAIKYYFSAGHHEQEKNTGQVKCSAVAIKQRLNKS